MQIEQNQFQDQLVRGLTHRMNNILTLFHGYVGMMLENQELDKSLRDNLIKIKDGAAAASELMDRTYSLVKPSSLVWREIDLTEFLQTMKPVFEGFCRHNIKIEIHGSAELPTIWVDVARLKTAVSELVRNACEAAGAGNGVVQVKASLEQTPSAPANGASRSPKPLKRVVISVIDNGPGIDPDAEERIFLPFFSTKKRQNAAGLGLTVASGLVQQLGGVLRHESKPGHTCFEVLLPARTDAR